MLGTVASLICLVPATWACACYLAYTLAGMLHGWGRTRPQPGEGSKAGGKRKSSREFRDPVPSERRAVRPPVGTSKWSQTLSGEATGGLTPRRSPNPVLGSPFGTGIGDSFSCPPPNPRSFAILIPAHNEESTLPATLRSVAWLDYPADRVRVFVVADNCSDRTADVARAAGASSFVRDDPTHRGKGLAVAFGLDRLAGEDADIILILDADCTLSPNALYELDAAFAAGADVAQTAVRSRNADEGPAGYVAAIGAEFDDGVAAGRSRLGKSVPLRGTGMAFRREVLGWVRWCTDSPVEDAEYDRQLRVAGGRVRYCGRAVVSCEAPAGAGELYQQRRRWRAAIRDRGWMESKPVVLAQLLVTLVVCFAAGAFVWWAVVLVALTAAIYARAVVRVGVSWRRARLLFGTPAVVARLVWVVLGGLVSRKVAGWDRAPRVGDRRVA